MKKKLLLLVVLLLVVGGGVALYLMLRPRPMRIAMVNYPEAACKGMMRSVDKENVTLHVVNQTEELASYDAVIAFGMGLKWTEEDRERVKALGEKGIAYLTLMTTTPENDLKNIDSAKLVRFMKYFRSAGLSAGATNLRSGFNYFRAEILGKGLRSGEILDPIDYPGECLFAKNLSDKGFVTVGEFQAYYNEHGFREGAPKLAFFTGMAAGPFSPDREHLDSIIDGFEKVGFNVYPINAGGKRLEYLNEINPDLVVYIPHGRFMMGESKHVAEWFKRQNIPLFAPLTVNMLKEAWEADPNGMLGGFLSQSVVTPEMDGALMPYVIVAQQADEDGVTYNYTLPDRMETFAQTLWNYVSLRRKPNKEKRVALYYLKGPGANSLQASGLEVIESLYNVLKELQAKGYNLEGLPATAKEFGKVLMTQAPLFNSYAEGSTAAYLLSGYPELVRGDSLAAWMSRVMTPGQMDTLRRRYGAVPGEHQVIEKDGVECIGVAKVRFGNVVLIPQPAQGVGTNDFKMVHGSAGVPAYPFIAAYLWARHGFKADVMMHFGTHGSLEFIQGKQVALSSQDYSDRLVYDIPHAYYYTTANVGEGMIAKRRSYAQLLSYLPPPFIATQLEGAVGNFLRLTDQYLSQEKDDPKLGLQIKQLALKEGYHRDLKLDTVPTTPYSRAEIDQLADFIQELASAKIVGGAYITGETFPEAKIQSSVTLMSEDPVAYALSQIDFSRGKVTTAQLKSTAYFDTHYLKPAERWVKRLQANPSLQPERLVKEMGVTAEDLAVAKKVALWEESQEDQGMGMMGMMGGGMPPAAMKAMGGGMSQGGMPPAGMGGKKPEGMGQGMPQGGMPQGMPPAGMASKAPEGMGQGMPQGGMPQGMPPAGMASKAPEGMGKVMPQEMPPAGMGGKKPEGMGQGMPQGMPPAGMGMPSQKTMVEEPSAEEKQLGDAVNLLLRSLGKVAEYDRLLHQSPQIELDAILNAFAGGYTASSSAGDFISNPDVLPTGRNLFAIDAESTPTKNAWTHGKQLADDLIADYKRRNNGEMPRKVSFSLWSSSFIESEGTTIAEILYLLGAEPVYNRMGRVQDVRLMSLEELGRPRIDVLIQTSGQFRDLAASRLFLIQKAVNMAAEAEGESEEQNQILSGVRDAERVLLDKGVSPIEARKLSKYRVFGGLNGAYGTGIQGMVESGDSWETRKEIADAYINNMGAFYGDRESWEGFSNGVFEAAMQNTDAVVQPRQSNTWGALSLDHVYEFMGGLTLAVREVTGKDPEGYFSDLRNRRRVRTQELKQAIGVEARTTILNPTYIKELVKGGATTANSFDELVRNTYSWNVMKPSVIDKELWDDIYKTYVLDDKNLGTVDFFERENPAALQDFTATMLETVRKGMWKASPEQVKKIAELHAESVKKHNAGCSGMVCGNVKLHDFIAENLPADQGKDYKKNIDNIRQAPKSNDGAKSKVLKKESSGEQANAASDTPSKFPWVVAAAGIIALLVVIQIVRRRRKK